MAFIVAGWWFRTCFILPFSWVFFMFSTDEFHHFSEGVGLNQQPEMLIPSSVEKTARKSPLDHDELDDQLDLCTNPFSGIANVHVSN